MLEKLNVCDYKYKNKKENSQAILLQVIYKVNPIGFEPTVPCGTLVFKTSAFDHSANLPNMWFTHRSQDGT